MPNIIIIVTISMYFITLSTHLSEVMNIYRLFFSVYSTLYVITNYLSCTLQVAIGGTKQLELSCSDISKSFMASGTNTMLYESGNIGLSIVNSKGFFMFSAADVSLTIDFSRAELNEGILESPPNKGNGRIPVCSPSSLKNSRKDGICRSLSPERYGGSMHPRQLYKNGPFHISNGLDIANASESFSHQLLTSYSILIFIFNTIGKSSSYQIYQSKQLEFFFGRKN